MTPAEFNPMESALEQAVTEIRNDSVDPAVIEAAAARVWARLTAADQPAPMEHIRSCSDFRSLMPDYRARKLSAARATLLQDHLHQCVDCRRVYEGRVVAMPSPQTAARRSGFPMRWAAAAVVVMAAGLSVWIAVDRNGTRTGHAVVQTVNGNLYVVSAEGIRPLLAGQDLPDGIEIRTAQNSNAMLELRDGSIVEMRERSGFSTTQSGSDLTVRLDRGSVIVQAAHRRTGHLYVTTADCRVAVTGTIFSVSAGVKGSRVSVVEGEVRVAQDNQEKVLRPGDQAVTSVSLERVSVKEDISWSRNRDRLYQQLSALTASLQQIHLPALRYSSRLLDRLPASTAFFASVPNLSEYLAEAETVFEQKVAGSPELRSWMNSRNFNAGPVLTKLRAASEYLGDEIDVVGFSNGNGKMIGPAFLAETKRDGFREFLQKEAPGIVIEVRPGIVVFGPSREAVNELAAALDSPGASFKGTPFHARISESFRNGAGFLLCADLSQMNSQPIAGGRFLICEQKEVNGQKETSASLGFEGERSGIAAWLASPGPMGSLDYVSPEATLVTAFVVKSPAVIVDQVMTLQQRSQAAAEKTMADVREHAGFDVRNDLAASLGGEFSLSMDGPVIPVPSWKLVAEVYDPAKLQATLLKAVEAFNRDATKSGGKLLRTAQEKVDGRDYFMIAWGDPNPLTEAHYTFTGGYLVAGPTRALVAKSLQVKVAGTSITRSTQFLAMEPRDHHANFSALVYQNLGTTLAPVIGLLGAFAPPGRPGQPNPLQSLGNMKPTLVGVYGEPDRITVSGTGNLLGNGMAGFLSGNLLGVVGNALPMGQMLQGSRQGVRF